MTKSSNFSDNRALRLAKAVEDYLLSLIENDYAATTIRNYGYVLKHFQNFINRSEIQWEDVFTHDTLKRFEKQSDLSLATIAVRGLARHLYQLNQISAPIRKPTIPLPDIYEDYLAFCEKNKEVQQSYLNATKNVLSALNDYLTTCGIALKKLCIEHIDNFLCEYNAQFMPATCRYNRSYLRGFLKYLYDRRIVKRNLAPLVVGPPKFAYTNPPKFLLPEQVKKLFCSLATETAKDLRSAAMVHLGYTLGLRPKEISRIRLDDIVFAKGQISVPDRKSTQPITLPLPEITIKAIAAYIVGGRPKTDQRALFLTLHPPFRPVAAHTVSHDVTKALRKISPEASAYWLRHTYAQNLLESEASIFEVKQMMGHGNVQSTRRYIHIHTKMMRKVLFDETL